MNTPTKNNNDDGRDYLILMALIMILVGGLTPYGGFTPLVFGVVFLVLAVFG